MGGVHGGPFSPTMRPMVGIIPRNITWAALAAMMGFMAGPAQAETVKPLTPAECDKVRQALEDGLPFGPGFRRMEVDFPKNDRGIEGQVCRLLTLGTGVHMEGPKIRSLNSMGGLVRGALSNRGWAETPQTARFSEKSAPGRQVFALIRGEAACVTTIVIDVVKGIAPRVEAYKDGKIRLSQLRPHQREWWVSIDCFGVPAAEGAQTEAKAMPAPGAMSPEAMPPAPKN